MSRRHNPERVLLHRSYTISEITELFDIGRHAVSEWIRAGLTPIDGKRPLLFAGDHLHAFVKARMAATRRPSGPGQMYCVACKKTRTPENDRAKLEIVSATAGNMVGRCPHCTRLMYRRVKLSNLDKDCGSLTLTPKARDGT